MFVVGRSAHLVKRVIDLYRQVEFHGGILCVVYNIHNHWSWRLYKFIINGPGSRPRGDLGRLFDNVWHSLRNTLHDGTKPHVMHSDLHRRLH